MSIDMHRIYTADEIEALNLPEWTVLEDKDSDAWVKRGGRFECDGGRDTAYYEPFRIIHIPGQPEVETPPEVDWATPNTKWFRTWVAVEPGEESGLVKTRRMGERGGWSHWSRDYLAEVYGIPADQLPPPRPAWPSPHGVTIEQAREIAAALAEHEAVK